MIRQEFLFTLEMPSPVALPEYGYGDVCVCADIWLLPPAPGTQPFWPCHAFQRSFEVFSLTEDRCHEKDIHMQT